MQLVGRQLRGRIGTGNEGMRLSQGQRGRRKVGVLARGGSQGLRDARNLDGKDGRRNGNRTRLRGNSWERRRGESWGEVELREVD